MMGNIFSDEREFRFRCKECGGTYTCFAVDGELSQFSAPVQCPRPPDCRDLAEATAMSHLHGRANTPE